MTIKLSSAWGPTGRTVPARKLVAAAMVLAALAVGGCSSASSPPSVNGTAAKCRTLAPDPAWYGDNRDRLDRMISQLGTCNKSGSVGTGAPLALFDWDNTMVRNDIAAATFYWMVRNSKFHQPTRGDWTTTSQFPTPPAAAAMAAACGRLAAPGQLLPTGTDTRCADELVSVYRNGETHSGAKAFAKYNHRRFKPVDAWSAQLLAGWTDAEVTEFVKAARQENLDGFEGAEQTVGSTLQTAWVRYYPQMRDLVGTLQTNGFDVRIISASPEPVVQVWAADLGIDSDRVMGVRTEHDGDVLTSRLAFCGGEPSMTHNEGKRCRINEQVFGVVGPAAFGQLPDPRRQVFAAGDSDGDVTFTIDATVLRLVINRNQIELMCRAYDNSDGRWLINPMFIDPPGASSSYPCATRGFNDPDGGQAPLRRADGSIVPDQQDRVYRGEPR